MPALRITLTVLLWAATLSGVAACGSGTTPRPERTPAQAGSRTPSAAPEAPHPRPDTRVRRGPAWTLAAVVAHLDGRSIRVAGRRVAIDAATVTCGGEGPARRRAGGLAWSRFRCVQPTFPAGAIAGPDAVFLAEPTGRRTLIVRGARFAS
jgi:hypothetical protein